MPFDQTTSMATTSKKRLRGEDSEGSPEPANAQSVPEEVIGLCTWSVVEEYDEHSHEWFEPFEEYNHEMRSCRKKLLEEIRHFVGDRDPYTCIPESRQMGIVKDEEPHGYRLSLLRAILEGLRDTAMYRRIQSKVHHELDDEDLELKSEQSDEERNGTGDHDEANSPQLMFPGKRELDKANEYLEYVDEYRCLDCMLEKKSANGCIVLLQAQNRLHLERIAELEKMIESRLDDPTDEASLPGMKRKNSEDRFWKSQQTIVEEIKLEALMADAKAEHQRHKVEEMRYRNDYEWDMESVAHARRWAQKMYQDGKCDLEKS